MKPGEKLPSVRDFALQLKVNPNTVQKAMNMLEMEKLIFTERTNGKFITKDENLIKLCREDYARQLTKDYKNKMKEIGLEIQEVNEKQYSKMPKRK